MSNATPIILVGSGNATPVALSSSPRASATILSTQGNAVPVILAGGGNASPIYIENPPAPAAETTAWKNAVVAAGGVVSDTTQFIANLFITNEMSSGLWALTDDYWPLWAENLTQMRVSLKQLRLGTIVGNPIFDAYRGLTPLNTAGNYFDSLFIADVNSVVANANNVRLGIYVMDNLGGVQVALGANANTNRYIKVSPAQNSGVMRGNANGGNAEFSYAPTGAKGWTVTSRNGPLVTDQLAFKNGVPLTRTLDAAGVGATLPGISLFIGCLNNIGTATGGFSGQLGFAVYGAALTPAQEIVQYNNISNWGRAVGALVGGI